MRGCLFVGGFPYLFFDGHNHYACHNSYPVSFRVDFYKVPRTRRARTVLPGMLILARRVERQEKRISRNPRRLFGAPCTKRHEGEGEREGERETDHRF